MGSWSRIARRIRVPLGFAFAVVYLWLASPTSTSLLRGACVAALGLLLRGLASGHVTKDEQLTTSGPYAHVRNPLYLGSLLIATGFVLAARSWWVLVLLIAMFLAIYMPVIRAEEAFLRATFPEFEDYARHVPRFLPRLRPFGNSPGAFSWKLYRKHREYHAAIGTAAMLLALAAKLEWWPK